MKVVLPILPLASLLFTACVSDDPDLDPQPTAPRSEARQTPWNEPIPGQGGGAFGALPQQPRR